MAKFSLPQATADRVVNLFMDKDFHTRALKRITTETEAVFQFELMRIGQKGKEVQHIDLAKGEITVGDIIKPADNKKVIIAKK